jgi:CO/xanthine dehydrogenase Mo-binding subunit
MNGLLWGKILRSPHAHAKILSVDTSRAARVPGVHAVITGTEYPRLIGRAMKDLPVLAYEKVRFIGERVAAVAAETAAAASQALDLIEVVYEELQPVFDMREALSPGAPLVHDDPTSYVGAYVHPERPNLPNLCSYDRWTAGDLAAAFASADHISENTFHTQKQHHAYMEPHACIVSVQPDGAADVWASNKSPYALRGQLAASLGVEPASIRVHPMAVGGDFGGKGSPMDTPVAYLLSQVSGRPVKIVMGYDEELLAANTRHPSEITVRTGFKNDGTLTALEVNAHFDSGAYGAFKAVPNINLHAMELTASCYRVPVFDVRSSVAYTNTVPSGHMRSPGGPQITFAVESQLNIVAAELGIDPAELRVKNLIRPGDSAPNGEQWVNIKAVETLQAALDAIGWGEPLAPNTGRGLAMYERGAIGGDSSCKLVLHADGALTLILPIPDPGQGGATVMQQIAAEHLGVEPARIAVRSAPTDELPFDLGVGGSRTTFALGVTVAQAAETLMARLQEHGVAAPFEETAAALIASEGGDDVIIDVYRKIPFLPDPPTTEFTAQAAEVKVDPETGQVTVLRLVTAHDVGTIINPAGHQGQIAGGAIQGFGMGMIEELAMADGKPLALNLADYKIPSIMDIPALQTILVARDDGPGPFNSGAIAEAANVPTAAAIANAVHAATGKPVRDLPVSAEYVVGLLRG